MKKLFSILLVVAMVMSLFTASTLAITLESDNVVYTQDFSNAQSGTNYTQASSGYVSLGENGSEKWLRISANSSASSTQSAQAGGKVFINNSKMEIGKTYVISVDVTFTPQSVDASTVTSRRVNMKVLNGTGSTVVDTATTGREVPVGQTARLSTGIFEYTEALKANTANLRIDFNGFRINDTDKDVVTVDNVEVVEIVGLSIFKNARNVTFDDIEEGYVLDSYDFDKNKGNTPTIVASPSYSGNSLKITPTANDNRHTLKGFFDENDLGKTYRITMKVYPTSVSAKGIRIGSKPYIPSSNSGWNNDYFFTVGEEGSTADMIVNTWNTISFTATIGNYAENSVTYIDDSIAFVQTGSTTLIDEFYVDDIVIEEYVYEGRTESYFKGMVSDSAVTKSFEEEDLEIIKGTDVKDGSTGFGAISITSETARTGTKSLKITGRTVATGRFKLLDAFSGAKKGEMYRVSAYVKVAGTNSENARVTLAAMSNEYFQDMYYSYAIANSTDWAKIEFLYIVDEDANGNVMDELAIAQEGHNIPAVDTIYIDDITVEPVTEDTLADVVVDVKGNITSYSATVKYSVEENAFDGVDNPFMFVVVTNTDDEIMKVDVASYDENKTEYIYYIKGLTHELIGSVKLFKWNGDNLYPVSATVNLK